ncbi:hypothetical protein AAVH_20793 [Aphelenchoides avenae]|nr:hypothetical protein AAVH_20793 [Aphelenchus avenae]
MVHGNLSASVRQTGGHVERRALRRTQKTGAMFGAGEWNQRLTPNNKSVYTWNRRAHKVCAIQDVHSTSWSDDGRDIQAIFTTIPSDIC